MAEEGTTARTEEAAADERRLRGAALRIDHVAVAVRDLEVEGLSEVLEELGANGCDLLTGVVRSPGLQQAFTRREPNSGVQLEFVSRGGEDGFSQSNIEQLFEAMERDGSV